MGAVTMPACSDDAKSTANDAGPADVGIPDVDAHGDGGADACKAGPPASGITQLDAEGRDGQHTVMVLDETGSPVVAYMTDTGDQSALSISVKIRRWDPTCSTWTPPITVDTFGNTTSNGRQLSLAFDASTGTVGILWMAVPGKFGVDEHYEIRYAELKKGASTITAPVRVEDPKDNDHAPESPALGMANGKVFVAYHESYRLCGTSGCAAIVYRSRDAGGTWSAESELAGNGATGYDATDRLSLAVDSSGNPGVAWISTKSGGGGGTDERTTFIRPGGTTAAVVFDNTDNTGTDNPWVELAFDGVKPRAVVIQNMDANYSTDRKTEWFVASDDGTTWSAPVALPHDAGSSLDSFASLAIAGGKVVIASSSNQSDGTHVFGQPKILTSTDLTSFAVSGVPKNAFDGLAKWPSIEIGADGKVQMAFQGAPTSVPNTDGVLYYREP